MTILQTLLTAVAIASPIAACAADTTGTAGIPGSAAAAGAAIHVNQLGYLPGSAKLAVVGLPPPAAAAADHFTVEDANGRRVLEGRLSPAATWAPAGQQARVADFSALRAQGRIG